MTQYKNTMLVSPDEVKAQSAVDYNVSDDTIGYAIRTAQNTYLEDIIGSELLNKLRQLVYNAIKSLPNTIDDAANADYKELLEDYIQPYLISKAQVELCMPISLKIRNIGVAQDSDTNINAAQLDSIKYLRNTYETNSCKYATRLSTFLCRNKESYPELSVECECGHYVAPNIGDHYANTGLWLGKDGNKCKKC